MARQYLGSHRPRLPRPKLTINSVPISYLQFSFLLVLIRSHRMPWRMLPMHSVHSGHSIAVNFPAKIQHVPRLGAEFDVIPVHESFNPAAPVRPLELPSQLPADLFDFHRFGRAAQLRDGTANHRSQFYQDITMPFYGFNRPGAKISQGIRDNWWRQGMMGGIKAQYDCVKALSETAFFDDLKSIDVPVLVMHGEDDQICSFEASGKQSVKLLKYGTLKSYPGFPHGMPTTNADQINADLLAFFKGAATAASSH